MGCAAGANTRCGYAGQSPSSGGMVAVLDRRAAVVKYQQSFHAKYLLGGRIGKGSYALVHAVSKNTPAEGLREGAKVKVQIVGSGSSRYNGLRGKIVIPVLQNNLWHVKLDVDGKAVFWWTKGENLILEEESASQATRAVKIIDMRDIAKSKCCKPCVKRVRACKNEISVWRKVMVHANMVHLHEVFLEQYVCYIIMERCHSSLFKYMGGLPVLHERSIGELLVQMTHAIKHMHSYRVVHRDVKPDNFLMGGPDGSTVKLCDFGLAQEMSEAGQVPGVHGTAPYMCPEMLRFRLSDEKADVWAIGVIAYLLLCGKFPYQPQWEEWSPQKMRDVILDGGHPTCERSWLSQSASSMLTKMLSRKPVLRPTAQEALYLPFMVDATVENKVPEENLPCLKPVVEAAFWMGTAQKDLDQECDLDRYLSFKQVQSHGMEIPRSQPSNYMPEMPQFEGDWISAQQDALSRAMAHNVTEAYGKVVSSSLSAHEKLPLKSAQTSESDAGACGSDCSTAVEQNQEDKDFVETMLGIKVEG